MEFSTTAIVFVLLLGLLYWIFWIWAIVDLLKPDFKGSGIKIIRVSVLLFANPIGPIDYLKISKEQKSNQEKYFNTQK